MSVAGSNAIDDMVGVSCESKRILNASKTLARSIIELLAKNKKLDEFSKLFNNKSKELNQKQKEIENLHKKVAVDKDSKSALIIADRLLGNLPKKVIDEFAVSKDFDTYKKVLETYGLK